MVTTPWDLNDRFTQMLTAQAGRDDQIGANAMSDIFAAELARQNADAAWGRQLSKDKIDFAQQIARDNANRQFIHDENYRKGVEYKKSSGGGGRFDFINQPGAGAPAGGGAPPVAGSASDETGRVTPHSAYAYLTSQGISPIVAAGIIGNVHVESANFDPHVFTGTNRGDHGTAYGAGQWREDRQVNLFKFAQSRGHDRPTPEDQFDFFMHEAETGSDQGARTAMQLAAQAKTPEEAAAVIAQHYERPRDMSSLPLRQSAARQIYGTAGAGAQPAVPPQRRYTDPNVAAPPIDPNAPVDPNSPIPVAAPIDPTADPLETAVTEAGQPDMTEIPLDPVDPGVQVDPNASAAQTVEQLKLTKMRPLTAAELQQANITPFDLTMVPEGYDIVGTRFFSYEAYNNMDSEMRDLLVPLGGLNKNAGNEFLVLQSKDPNDVDPVTGEPTYNPEKAQPVAPAAPAPAPAMAPAPMPTASTQVQVPQPPMQTVQGTPTQPVSTAAPTTEAPTGKRTRRNAQGQLEILVDDQWRTTGVGGGNG